MARSQDNLTARQIRATLEGELAKKGLSKVEADSADLFIGYQIAINTEKEVNSFDTGWGATGPDGVVVTDGMTTSTTSTLYVGSLALDMYDSSKKQLVGVALPLRHGPKSKTRQTRKEPTKGHSEAPQELPSKAEGIVTSSITPRLGAGKMPHLGWEDSAT